MERGQCLINVINVINDLEIGVCRCWTGLMHQPCTTPTVVVVAHTPCVGSTPIVAVEPPSCRSTPSSSCCYSVRE